VRDVVAIDGPAGAGKSSVSRGVARRLGYRHVDTGAMYRVIGVLAHDEGIDAEEAEALAALCDRTAIEFEERGDETRVLAGGRDLTRAIRSAEAGQWASRVSAVPAVRERLVARQRQLAGGGRVVMEGRDIGTVVLPGAGLKVFLDASPRERARRRAAELEARGEVVDLERMTRDIEERDARDRGRAHSPLRPAEDAVTIDTTGLALAAVIDDIVKLAHGRARP
jgi:cytidylate kinase